MHDTMNAFSVLNSLFDPAHPLFMDEFERSGMSASKFAERIGVKFRRLRCGRTIAARSVVVAMPCRNSVAGLRR
jgi:hypothetical protein